MRIELNHITRVSDKLIKFKCPNCDIKYNTEDLRNNCDSWISELCVKSISLKQWRYQNARD